MTMQIIQNKNYFWFGDQHPTRLQKLQNKTRTHCSLWQTRCESVFFLNGLLRVKKSLLILYNLLLLFKSRGQQGEKGLSRRKPGNVQKLKCIIISFFLHNSQRPSLSLFFLSFFLAFFALPFSAPLSLFLVKFFISFFNVSYFILSQFCFRSLSVFLFSFSTFFLLFSMCFFLSFFFSFRQLFFSLPFSMSIFLYLSAFPTR